MASNTNTNYNGMVPNFVNYKLKMPTSCFSQRFTLASILGDVSGKRVLDIGCGFGYHGTHVKRNGAAEVFGFDYSQEEVDYAINVTEKADPSGMTFAVGDCLGDWSSFGVAAGSFDLAMCMQVLIHLTPEGVEATFASAAKALKSGGRFVGSVPMPTTKVTQRNATECQSS